MRILVINCGSTSLKYKLYETEQRRLSLLAAASVSMKPGAEAPVAAVLAALPARPDAVAHRVVHGGDRFTAAVRVDDDILRALTELTPLAHCTTARRCERSRSPGAWAFPSLPPSIPPSSLIFRRGPGDMLCHRSPACTAMGFTAGLIDL